MGPRAPARPTRCFLIAADGRRLRARALAFPNLLEEQAMLTHVFDPPGRLRPAAGHDSANRDVADPRMLMSSLAREPKGNP